MYYRKLKEALAYLTIVLLFNSCNRNKQSTADEMPPLYPAPITVALNTQEGYIINPVTGDSIKPIVNSLGDTIKTGVPVPAIGKTIHPDSVAQPKIIPAGEPKVVPTNLNVHKIPEVLTIIPVNKDSLKTFTPDVDTSSFVLVNSMGDTIPTGVPIPAKGKVVPCIRPQPVNALLPRMKDNASINIKYLDLDQGMNESHVLSILEDSRGDLWFGTYNGVSMYNGETFTHFTEKEGLSEYWVWSILEDSHGNLWFGTVGGGVSMYNGEAIMQFTEEEGLSNNIVYSILEDSHGNLWFGTWGGGVSMYNGETFTHFTEKEGLSSNYVYSILEDSHGNLWFGTVFGGVSMYNGETFTYFTEKEGLSSNHVSAILEDSHGNLWFGSWLGGVTKFSGETFTRFTEEEGLSNNIVRSICEDSHGNLWFGTLNGGVIIHNGETFTHFTKKEGLSSNDINSILEDSHGNLWFGTDGGGVSMYNSKPITHITENQGLSNDEIRCMLEDSHGNLWFGTEHGGVSMYNGETIIHFTEKEGLSSNDIMSIQEDSHGNLWFGTFGFGVNMYNGETFTNFTEKEGLSDNWEGMSSNEIMSITEDSNGNLWFGTNGGVSKYDGETFTNFTEKEGLSSNKIMSITEDSHGNLWFGTNGRGVSMYNGDTFTHFTEKEGLSNNEVYSIMEDSHGNLWFGTNGRGVSMYNGDTFTHFTEKEGLSNNRVMSILEDNSSNIWVSTVVGLNLIKFSPDSDSNTRNNLSASVVKEDCVNVAYNNPAIHSYSLQDGLKGMDFWVNSVLLDSKNRIWWGNNLGLTIVDVNNFKISGESPTIQLNRIDINEQFIDYRHLKDSEVMGMKFNDVANFYDYPINLELSYNRNHLTFHYSAIDWSAPHKLRYSFKMEGINRNWSSPTSEAKVDYRNLPFGTFTFKVRAIGEAQTWSEPFDYTFTIHPPWWHTWLARTGYGIAILLLIFGIIRWRTAKLKQRQKELVTEVRNATKEIRAQKEEVETQRDEIEAQRDQLEIQRDVVVTQKQEITDSINYAKHIQTAILPSMEYLNAVIPEYFVLFKPKDIVSGDFYWIKEVDNCLIIVAADCTGHGVPGAFMSMLGITLLNEQIGRSQFDKPGEMLDRLRGEVKNMLAQEGKLVEQKDGMDMAIVIVDKVSEELQYAGANIPLYLIRNKKLLHTDHLEQYSAMDNEDYQLFEIKADMQPIGIYWIETNFTTKQVQLKKGDSIYLFSDGIVDQKGGPNNKKFLSKNFKRSLLEIQTLSMEEQRKKLDDTLESWRTGFEQMDDILIMGVRI